MLPSPKHEKKPAKGVNSPLLDPKPLRKWCMEKLLYIKVIKKVLVVLKIYF
jgi:hypothetical protein